MKPYWQNGIASLHQADAREIPLPDGSVHCVVTSPPYWGLRDYGLGDWQGGDAECKHERPRSDAGDFRNGTAYVGSSSFQWPNGVCGRCGATQAPAGIGLEATLAEHLHRGRTPADVLGCSWVRGRGAGIEPATSGSQCSTPKH